MPPGGERPKVAQRVVSDVLGRWLLCAVRGGVRSGDGARAMAGADRDARLARRAMIRRPGDAGSPASASSVREGVRERCEREESGEYSSAGECAAREGGPDREGRLCDWDTELCPVSLCRSSASALRSGWILRGRGDGSDEAVGSGGLGGAGGGGAGFETVNARRRSRVKRLGMVRFLRRLALQRKAH